MSDIDEQAIEQAVAALKRGELVGMPTETVYGLAADANNELAVRQIFALKGRPADHPVIVHLARAEQMIDYAVDISPLAWQLARRFWPGPMTLILNRHPSVSDLITGGQDSVGLRVPSHPVAHALLERFGRGLAAPSANKFGRISPTQARHVRAEFGAELAIVLDGGDAEIGIESTIIDARSSTLKILRPGDISAAQLLEFAPANDNGAGSSPRVSGALDSHYAPRTPARLCERAEIDSARQSQVVMCFAPLPKTARGIALENNPKAYAQKLYATLRELDGQSSAEILIERPPAEADWLAVIDRLRRACHS